MKIRGLSSFRYSITDLRNEGMLSSLLRFSVLARAEVSMSLTYDHLVKTHVTQLTGHKASQQIIRNHLTAIRHWLRFLGKGEDAYIDDELGGGFDAAVKRHLSESTLSERSSSDRRSLLRAWRSTFEAIQGGTSDSDKGSSRRERRSMTTTAPLNPFEAALKAALAEAKLAPKGAARLASVSASALGRWTRGALPNERSRETIEKLERSLKLPGGTLLDAWSVALRGLQPGQANEYRLSLKGRTQSPYRISTSEVSPALQAQWTKLLKYKTAVVPNNLRRHRSAVWSLMEPRFSTTAPSVFSSLGAQVCPAAAINWAHLVFFLGYLRLPLSQGGGGRTLEESQSLAWLAVPDAIDGYLTFLTTRSNGRKHNGHKTFCSFVASLTHAEHGYLTQSPNLRLTLPDDVAADMEWQGLCALARETAGAWKLQSTEKSRDPELPIRFFLEKPTPLAPLFDAMNRLREVGNSAPMGSTEELIARRDELLLGMLTANPLRLQNWMTMRYLPDNSGDIYKTASGGWRISVNGGRFKNRKRLAGKKYEVAVADWLTPLLDEYVQTIRPKLVEGHPDIHTLFVSSRGGMFRSLGRHVFKITRRYVPGSGGIGPHAFRHLVATNYLLQFPDDFMTVAELLNDTLAVVMANYAHLKRDRALTRHDTYLATLVSQARGGRLDCQRQEPCKGLALNG